MAESVESESELISAAVTPPASVPLFMRIAPELNAALQLEADEHHGGSRQAFIVRALYDALGYLPDGWSGFASPVANPDDLPPIKCKFCKSEPDQHGEFICGTCKDYYYSDD